jgi:hypothetical protein
MPVCFFLHPPSGPSSVLFSIAPAGSFSSPFSAERQRLGQHLMQSYLGQDGLLQSVADLDADLEAIQKGLQVGHTHHEEVLLRALEEYIF